MVAFFTNLPDIIAAASKSPLGISALTVAALSFISFFFFRRSSEWTRIAVFFLMGIGAFIITVIGIGASSITDMTRQRSDPKTWNSPPPVPTPIPTTPSVRLSLSVPTPISTRPSVQPSPAPIRLVAGTWRAQMASSVIMTITIDSDGTYTKKWHFLKKNVEVEMWGSYYMYGNYIDLNCGDFSPRNTVFDSVLSRCSGNLDQLRILDQNHLKSTGTKSTDLYRIR